MMYMISLKYTQELYQKHLTGNFRCEYMDFVYIIIS